MVGDTLMKTYGLTTWVSERVATLGTRLTNVHSINDEYASVVLTDEELVLLVEDLKELLKENTNG